MLKKISSSFHLSLGILSCLTQIYASQNNYEIEGFEHIFNEKEYNRHKIIVKSYATQENKNHNTPAVLFLHGGPGLENEGQFDQFFSKFIQKGYTVYAPEIISSSAYTTSGQDANEYTKNYQKDIQTVLHYISEKTTGPIYAIAHSFGCHQLLRFIIDSSFNNKIAALTAIAGPSDLGANRLYAVRKMESNTKEEFNKETLLKTFRYSMKNSLLGHYSLLNGEDQKDFTLDYNPVVTKALNEKFSIIYHAADFPQTLPIQLIHAKDDSQACFSLSIDLYKELKNQGRNVSGYFLSQGNHGFIKNPIDPTMSDTNAAIRNDVADNICNFFESQNSKIFLDGNIVNIENITYDTDARKLHQDFLKHLKGISHTAQ